MAQLHQSQVQHNQQVSGWTGWIVFAGVLMAITGLYHAVLGLGGIFGQDWYIYSAGQAWLFDSSAWGWSMLIGGIALILSAMLLMAGNIVGRIVGSILVAASLFANLAVVAIAPVWSLIAIVADLMILYAILVHGKEMKRLAE